MARLENWSVVMLDASPYMAPESQPRGLHGVVYDREGFPDGTPITTSTIQRVYFEGDNVTVVTRSGSYYLLGGVDPEWEKLFPDARERFINNFKEQP